MITVGVDEDAVGRHGGRAVLPGMYGVLVGWGHARDRRVRSPGDTGIRVRPRRTRCRECSPTHVLLPVVSLSRRADHARVIGAALAANAPGAVTGRWPGPGPPGLDGVG